MSDELNPQEIVDMAEARINAIPRPAMPAPTREDIEWGHRWVCDPNSLSGVRVERISMAEAMGDPAERPVSEYQRGERVEWSNGGWGVLEARSQDEDTGTPEFCMDHDDGRPARLWVIRFDNGMVKERCCEREIKARAESQQGIVRIRLPHDFTCQQVANNAAPEFPKDGCRCMRCEEARGFDPGLSLDKKDREIAELKADIVSWSKSHDAAVRDRSTALAAVIRLQGEIIGLEAYVASLQTNNAELLGCVVRRDARIAELDTELAAFRGQDIDTDHDRQKPNPFRDFPTDPRRMGP